MASLEDLIKARIAPVLKAAGFRKRRHLWNRIHGDLIHVVTLDKSPYCTRTHEDFTVNTGVFVPKVYDSVWHEQPPFIAEYHCQIREGIGKIIGGFETRAPHKWWHCASETEYEEAGREVEQLLPCHVLPFLARFQTMESVHGFMSNVTGWQSRDWLMKIYLSLVKREIGDIDGAKAVLEEIVGNPKSRGWADRAREILAALGDGL